MLYFFSSNAIFMLNPPGPHLVLGKILWWKSSKKFPRIPENNKRFLLKPVVVQQTRNIELFYIFKYLFNIIVQYKLSYVYCNLSFLHHMEGVAGPDTLYCTVYSIKTPQELTRRDDSCFSLDIVFAPCPWTTGVRFYKLVLEKNNGFKKNTIYMKKNKFFMDAILFLISS